MEIIAKGNLAAAAIGLITLAPIFNTALQNYLHNYLLKEAIVERLLL
jgi:hypothetical protein